MASKKIIKKISKNTHNEAAVLTHLPAELADAAPEAHHQAAKAEQPAAAQDAVVAGISNESVNEVSDQVAAADTSVALADVLGSDHGGQSLLVAAAAEGEAPKAEEDDDRKGVLWAASASDGSIFAAIASVAVLGLAAGGGSGSGPSKSVIKDGFALDGAVEGAVVFRDSDGDGKWLDVNGDGIWQSGDEYVTTTDSDGYFSGLGGEGEIVTRSLEGLVSKAAGSDIVYSLSDIHHHQITDSKGVVIDHAANDSGAAFTGVFVSPGVALATVTTGNTEKQTVYITGVSTLVSLVLTERGFEKPTEAQVIQAANDVASILQSNYGGTVGSKADAIDFFQSDLNQTISAFMAVVAGKAESEGLTGVDLQAAIVQGMTTLAQVVDLSGGNQDGAHDADNTYSPTLKLDLTDHTHLYDVFPDLNPYVAQAMASMIAAAAALNQGDGHGGSARPVIFQASTGSGDVLDRTVTNNGPLGDIAVLAVGGGSTSSLDVTAATDPSVMLANSNIMVNAIGNSSDASLNLPNAAGSLGGITVQTTGNHTLGTATINFSGDVNGDISVLAGGNSSAATLGLSSDVGAVNLVNSNILVQASGLSAEATLNLANATGAIGSIIVQSQTSGDNAHATISFSGDVNGDINVLAQGDSSNAGLALGSDGGAVNLVNSNILVQASGLGAYAGLGLTNATGAVGGITVQTQSADTNANATISFSGDVNGDINVLADGDYSMANLSLYDAGASTHLVDSNILVETSGRSADAGLSLAATGSVGNVTVQTLGSGDLSLAYVLLNGDVTGDVNVLADGDASTAGLLLGEDGGALHLTDSNILVRASGSSADAILVLHSGTGAAGDITVETVGSAEKAHAEIMFNGDVNGDITVSAQSNYSSADLQLGSDGGAVNLVDSNILVQASGLGAIASLDLTSATGAAGDITVQTLSSGDTARANILLNGDVNGNINVLAQGYNSSADLTLSSGVSADAGAVNLMGSNITVNASGQWASASLDLTHATGTVGDITVKTTVVSNDSGYGSYAYANIDLAGTVDGNIHVFSQADNSYADAEIRIEAPGTLNGNILVHSYSADSTAKADIQITGEYNGEYVVLADVNSTAMLTLRGSTDATLDLGNRNLDLEAVNNSSDIRLALVNTTVTADGNVVAGTQAVGASSTVTLQNSNVTLTSGDVNALARANSSDATVNLDHTQLNGLNTVNVEASGYDSAAYVNISGSIDVGQGIRIVASGDNSYGEISAYGVSGNLGDGLARASGSCSDARLYVSGDADLGALTVEAVGYNSYAYADINTAGSVQSVSAEAAGTNSYARASISAGEVGDITLEASGLSADAYVDVSTSMLHDSNITVTTSSSDTSASVGVIAGGSVGHAVESGYYFQSQAGGITVQTLGSADHSYAHASVDLNGTIAGDVVVRANGNSSDAQMGLNAYYSTDAVVTFDGSQIEVEASGYSASAYANIGNAAGTLHNLHVVASGSSSDARATISGSIDVTEGIQVVAAGDGSYGEINAYVSGSLGEALSNATGEYATSRLYVNGSVDLTGLTVTSSSYDAHAEAHVQTDGSVGHVFVDAYNESAYASADVMAGEVGDITVQSGGLGSHAAASVLAMSLNDSNITVTTYGAGSQASAEVWAGGTVGHAVQLADVDHHQSLSGGVTVQTLGGADHSSALARLELDGTINGDIVVRADAAFSSAEAQINTYYGENTLVNFDGSSIEVTALGENSWANAHIQHATGTIDSIAVVGASGSADARISFSGSADIGSVLVRSLGFSSDAIAGIETSGQVGDIKVDAYGWTNGYYGLVNASASVTAGQLTDSNITVTAGGMGVRASADVTGYTGTIGHTVSSADHYQSLAGGITVQTLNGADYGSARASVDINGTIHGDIVVRADGAGSRAQLGVNAYYMSSADATFAGSDVNVVAAGADSWVEANIQNAGGSFDHLSSTASGYGSSARLSVHGNGDLTVSGLQVTASNTYNCADLNLSISGDLTLDNADITLAATGDNSRVSMSLDASSIHGSLHDVTIRADGESTRASWFTSLPSLDVTGDIVVSAAGNDARASLDLNRWDDLTLGSPEHATNVAVEAAGGSSYAHAQLHNASGVADHLSVTASGSWSYAALEVDASNDLTVSGLQVTASGYQSYASLDVYANHLILDNADITVAATALAAAADLNLYANNIDGSVHDLTIRADGAYTNASWGQSIYELGVNGDILVTAGAGSADAGLRLDSASLDLGVGAHDTNITVEANAIRAQASADLTGARGTAGHVLVTSSGYCSDAELRVYAGDHLTVTGGLELVAAGDHSYASMQVMSSGTVTLECADITLAAIGNVSSTNLDLWVNNLEGSAHNVSIRAEGSYTHASLDFTLDRITGNVLISAGSYDANAWLQTHQPVELGTAQHATDLTVNAYGGAYARANLSIDSAYGSVGSIDVHAYGSRTSADLLLSVSWGDSLTVQGVKVAAGSYDSHAQARVFNVNLDHADINVTAEGDYSSASLTADISTGTASGITVTASGTCSDAYLSAYGFSVTMEGSDGITVLASGDRANAQLQFTNLNTTNQDIRVDANGEDSRASLDINFIQGNVHTVHVQANASSDAHAILGISGDITGGIEVLATHKSADASARIWLDGTVTGNIEVYASTSTNSWWKFREVADLHLSGDVHLSGTDILVHATGDNAYAHASLDLLSSTVHSINVNTGPVGNYRGASYDSEYSRASLDINTFFMSTLTVQQDITVNASSWCSDASFSANNVVMQAGNLDFHADGIYGEDRSYIDGLAGQVGQIHVSAAGASSDTIVRLDQVSAQVHDILVEASGYESRASLDIYADGGILSVTGDVTVNASHWYASADLHISGLDMAGGDISVLANGNNGEDHVRIDVLSGDVGTLSVRASGDASYAIARLDQVTANIGAIEVLAQGYNSNASLDMVFDGTYAGDLTVTAVSSDSWANLDMRVAVNPEREWQYYNMPSFTVGQVVEFHIGATTLSYVVQAGDWYWDVIDGLQNDPDYASSGVSFGAFNNNQIYVSWNEPGNQATSSLTVDGTAQTPFTESDGSLGSGGITLDGTHVNVTAQGDGSDARLNISNVHGSVSGIHLNAQGQNADARLSMDTHGTLTVAGDMVAEAARGYSSVYLSMDADITLQGDLTATATDQNGQGYVHIGAIGTSSASLVFDAEGGSAILSNASGAYAWSSVDVHNVEGLVTTVTATASGEGATANARIFAHNDALTISDAITATASGRNASVNVSMDTQRAQNESQTFNLRPLVDSYVAVLAAALDPTSNTYWDNLDSAAGAQYRPTLTLTVGGHVLSYTFDAEQMLTMRSDTYLPYSHFGNLMRGLDSAFDSFGKQLEALHEQDPTVPLLGDFYHSTPHDASYVQASATYWMPTTVEFFWPAALGAQPDVAVSYNTGAGDTALDLIPTSSLAGVSPYGILLDGVDLTATASGDYADAHMALNGTHGTIGNIAATASGYNSTASVDLTGWSDYVNHAGFFGTVTGDISATATSNGAVADVRIGYISSDVIGGLEPISLDGVNLAASANDSNSRASMDIGDSIGSVTGIQVSSVGDGAGAGVSLRFNGELQGNINVLAAGNSSDAMARIHARGASADTSDGVPVDGIHVTGADITVQADGWYSQSYFDARDLYGSLGAITVNASGTSADAMANMSFSGSLTQDIHVLAGGMERSYGDVSDWQYNGSSADLTLSAGYRRVEAFAASDLYSRSTLVLDTDGIRGTSDTAEGEVITLHVGGLDLSVTMASMNSGTDAYAEALFNALNDQLALVPNPGFHLSLEYRPFSSSDPESVLYVVYDDQGHPAPSSITSSFWADGIDPTRTWEAREGSTLAVDGINVDVVATGAGSEAHTNLDYLDGTIDTLTVSATAVQSDANAELRFESGRADHLLLNATQQSGYAHAAVEQTVQGGDVFVTGDGHVELTYTQKTASTIDLSGLHTGNDPWGVFDLNLSMADADLTDADASTLIANMVTIDGFDVSRDSINLDPLTTSYRVQTQNGWHTEGADQYSYTYSQAGVDYATVEDYIAAAKAALEFNGGVTDVNYFFGTVAGEDGYLAYDADGSGITGVVKLAGVTSFNELAVADRYSTSYIYSGGSDYDTSTPVAFTDTFAGTQAIDQLSMSTYTHSYNLSGLQVAETDVDATLIFEHARVQDIYLATTNAAEWDVYHQGTDSRARYHLTMIGSADIYGNNSGLQGDTLFMRQSDIQIEGFGYTDVRFDLSGASGDISSLRVTAQSGDVGNKNWPWAYNGSMDVHVSHSTLTINDIALRSNQEHSRIEAHFWSNDLTLNDSNIVLASGRNEHGNSTVNSNDWSNSHVTLTIGAAVGTIDSIRVGAYDRGSWVSADIANFDGTISGQIVVEALWNNHASLDIHSDIPGTTYLDYSSVYVNAESGGCSDLNIESATGQIGSLDINAWDYGHAQAIVTLDGSVEGLDVTAHWGSHAEANVTLSGSVAHMNIRSWDGSSSDAHVMLNGSVNWMNVFAGDGSQTRANVNVGTFVNDMHIGAWGSGNADATITTHGTVDRMSIDASNGGYTHAGIIILGGSVNDLHVSAWDGSNVDASLNMGGGTMGTTYIHMGDSANVALEINQGNDIHVGDVYVSGSSWDSMNQYYRDGDLELIYLNGGSAANVYLGYANAWEYSHRADDGQHDSHSFQSVNIELDFYDLNLDSVSDSATLLSNMMKVYGFDGAHGDSISFGGVATDNLDVISGASANFQAFLATADGLLDSDTSYVFGTVGGNGYLAYDGDGTGITGVVELVGMTNITNLNDYIKAVGI